jgi:hypothetical protein
MPTCKNKGIVTKRDVMRTAIAMEQLSKYVSAEATMHNNGGAVLSLQSILKG